MLTILHFPRLTMTFWLSVWILSWRRSIPGAENRLTVNTGKTDKLRFSYKKILQPENHVAPGNNHLHFNSEFIYFDIKMYENLNFSSHIQCITSKSSKCTGIHFKIRDLLPMEARLNYYYGVILPHLIYNVIASRGANQTHLCPLIRPFDM